MAEQIPNKLFFRIREVTEITGIKPHVLRYWESEFSRLSPRKSRSGQRVYRKKDIETILKIKRLLYDERYTIVGAKKRLEEKEEERRLPEETLQCHSEAESKIADTLKALRQELQSLLSLLESRA
ncbi:MAG: MerR family transcriptional regulator, partial [Candidatus Tectomicrobia bacterium]|nr:MerR family transcriptional regulator [Candidatus Tectomicrobia bacterium]